MASSLFGQLDESLHDHLSTLVRLSRDADDGAVLELARIELPKMVNALLALLGEHQPDDRGRCPTCRRGPLRRRAPGPCRAYLDAHLSLIIAEDAVPRQRGQRHLRKKVGMTGAAPAITVTLST